MTRRFENGTEQSITRLLRELKEEIVHLRNELNRIEGYIVKERLETVEKALVQNYLRLYTDQMKEVFDKNVERLVRENCGKRERCIESFRAYLTSLLRVITDRGLKEGLADLDAKLSQVENTVQKALNTPCELCQTKLLETLRKEKRSFQEIGVLEPLHRDERIKEPVDTSSLVETLLEPLANSARLKIFIAVYNGRKSFSELSEITAMKGGHLIFHLQKLLSAGLMTQEKRKGDYIITPRGVDVIRKLFQIDSEQKSNIAPQAKTKTHN